VSSPRSCRRNVRRAAGTAGLIAALLLAPAVDASADVPVSRSSATGADASSGSLSVDTGDDQTAAPGERFDEPLVVYAENAAGEPASGIDVTFTVEEPAESRFYAGTRSVTVTTDEEGRATSPALVTGRVGEVFVVTAESSLGNVVFFETVAGRGLLVLSGDGQSAPAGAAFAEPLVVRTVDDEDQPVAGVAVTFTSPRTGPVFADGSHDMTVTSDARGLASVPGPLARAVPDTYRITATTDSVETVAFDIEVTT